MRVHDREQSTPFQCQTELQVRGSQPGRYVESWARYETTARSGDGSDGSVLVWTAIVECVARFSLDAPDFVASDDQLEAFALLVGTPALHPYAREWTQTLTSHTQYPAFTLGLLDSLAELDPEYVLELPDRDDSKA